MNPPWFGSALRQRIQDTSGKLQRICEQINSQPLVNQTLNSSSNNGKRKIDDDDEVPTLLASISKKSKTLGGSIQSLEHRSAVLTGIKKERDGFDLTDSMLLIDRYLGSQTDNEKPKVADLLKKGDKVGAKAKEKAAQKPSDGPRFKDLGGVDDLLDELKRRVVIPLQCPQLPWGLGAKPISGILLHGPSGCGKTTLARAIANEARVPFYSVTGKPEENIRELFSKAYKTAPSIVFIDEVDAIGSKSDKFLWRRILIQVMTCMDESHKIAKPDAASKNEVTPDGKRGYVLVIGATNSPDDLDPALRRRFEREFTLGVPDEIARTKILSVLAQNLKHKGALDLVKISRSTEGFVGVDLANLVTEASNLAVDRVIHRTELQNFKEKTHTKQNEDGWWNAWTPEDMEEDSVTMSDFEMAGKRVQPSSKREGFSSIPNVTWEDVGGLDELREEFYVHIVSRIECPDEYEENGLDLETGFLLYGPPGCGKTLIAKAIANEAGANFIYIKGPELLDKYVGESEKAVRTLFSRARTCKPCILFFDEIDSLTSKRGGREGGTLVVERVLNQLLIELDGADERKGVYVIGATNRPEVMDPAVVRPGRLGKRLYVPLPNADQRGLILKSLARTKRLDADVDLVAIGRSDACDKFSGADLRALINEANLAAFKERKKSPTANANANEGTSVSSSESSLRGIPYMIKAKHIDQALEKISPSVSDENIQFYNGLQKIFN